MLKYIALSLLFVVSTLAGRIVGGGKADISKHPYQASLQLKKINAYYYMHRCGLILIKPRAGITAAHCIENYPRKRYRIAAGSNSINDANAFIVNVREFIKHENFIPPTYENDVAVVLFVNSLPKYHAAIAPIALATQAPKTGSVASITGFGARSFGGYGSTQLIQANVLIMSNVTCDADLFLIYGRSRITDDMICAGHKGGGIDACQGDSGGPLTFNKTLVGVISWGFECARPGAPGVYASVPYFYKWILSKLYI